MENKHTDPTHLKCEIIYCDSLYFKTFRTCKFKHLKCTMKMYLDLLEFLSSKKEKKEKKRRSFGIPRYPTM